VSSASANDLLIGTANEGKIIELQYGLQELPLIIHTLREFKEVNSPAEVGSTYEENALLKARFYQQVTGFSTIADDSGIEAEYLQGQPGVFTARFGGAGLSDTERVHHLLNRMHLADNRRARFVCVIAFAAADFSTTVRGECIGRIALKPHGTGGFGYDPIFIPEGYQQTFGQLPATVKTKISHRGKAIQAVREVIHSFFQ
jgi:XTP/dITP diphosphohydrolase